VLRRFVAIGLAAAVVLGISGCSSKLSADEARMPASSEDFSGEQYKDVVGDLEDAGFTQVKAVPLGDLIVGLLHDPGDVKNVQVDGTKNFGEGDVFKKNAKIVVEYHSNPSKGGNSSTPAPEKPDDKARQDILTAANNAEFAAILKVQDPGDPRVEAFVSKYSGRTIEFDGNVASMLPHGDTQTLEDVLINSGDHSDTSASGPNFEFMGVSKYHLPTGLDNGMNVHVIAEIMDYEESPQLLLLQPSPVTISLRG